jgi:hypothetical protein
MSKGMLIDEAKEDEGVLYSQAEAFEELEKLGTPIDVTELSTCIAIEAYDPEKNTTEVYLCEK